MSPFTTIHVNDSAGLPAFPARCLISPPTATSLIWSTPTEPLFAHAKAEQPWPLHFPLVEVLPSGNLAVAIHAEPQSSSVLLPKPSTASVRHVWPDLQITSPRVEKMFRGGKTALTPPVHTMNVPRPSYVARCL